MPQYAQYNPAVAAPSPVIGWYDTEMLAYPNLPPSTDLVEVTAEQWSARLANPSGWAVSGGALVAYMPPAPPPPDTRLTAKAELDASDVTVIRCYEHGVAVPAEWTAYRAVLRSIVGGTSTTTAVPTRPAYPAGT